MVPMLPWWRGFRGNVRKVGEHKYETVGSATKVDDTTIRITELPIHKWTQSMKIDLEQLIGEKNDGPVKVLQETPLFIRFVLTCILIAGLQRVSHKQHSGLFSYYVPCGYGQGRSCRI